MWAQVSVGVEKRGLVVFPTIACRVRSKAKVAFDLEQSRSIRIVSMDSQIAQK